MAITNEMCQDHYLRASGALKKIIASPVTPEAACVRAQNKFDELNRDYIGWATDNIEKRTQAFREFTGKMRGVLRLVEKRPAIDGVKTLAKVVERATAVLMTADGAEAGGGTA